MVRQNGTTNLSAGSYFKYCLWNHLFFGQFMGDFNEVLVYSEKAGGISRPKGSIDAFCSVLLTTGLAYLGFSGYHFTWDNGRHRGGFIEK